MHSSRVADLLLLYFTIGHCPPEPRGIHIYIVFFSSGFDLTLNHNKPKIIQIINFAKFSQRTIFCPHLPFTWNPTNHRALILGADSVFIHISELNVLENFISSGKCIESQVFNLGAVGNGKTSTMADIHVFLLLTGAILVFDEISSIFVHIYCWQFILHFAVALISIWIPSGCACVSCVAHRGSVALTMKCVCVCALSAVCPK